VAVAVYVVEAVGETTCVPPLAPRVKVVPSVPVMTTFVAFAAVAVKVVEAPEVIDDGFAVREIVGGAGADVTTTTAVVVTIGPLVEVAVAVYVVVDEGLTT